MAFTKPRRLHPSTISLAFSALLASAIGACDGRLPDVVADASPPGVDSGPPRARFTVPSSLAALDGDHFFDHPWPSDLRREADGTVRLAGYVNPRESPLIKKYIAQLSGRLDGFSPAAAGYLAFSAKIDVTSLPAD